MAGWAKSWTVNIDTATLYSGLGAFSRNPSVVECYNRHRLLEFVAAVSPWKLHRQAAF
jgi:hypothetical protein